LVAAALVVVAGCASFQPRRSTWRRREARAAVTTAKVTVAVAALTVGEARDVLGVDVAGAASSRSG